MSRARSTTERMARAEKLVHEANRQRAIQQLKRIHAATKCIGNSMCMAVHMCEGECAAKMINARERSERDNSQQLIKPVAHAALLELQSC